MAAPPRYDLFHVKRGVAALAACFVQTLNEADPTFEKRFLKRLQQAYDLTRDNAEGEVSQELELLSFVRELLTGWSWSKRQDKPFLGD